MNESKKTASGLDQNVAAALSYALGWVTGLLFVLSEPENKFIRFHALQSIIVFAFLSVVCVLLQMIPLLGMLVTVFLVVPLSAVLWLILMLKAYQGERFKVPVAGDMAEQRV